MRRIHSFFLVLLFIVPFWAMQLCSSYAEDSQKIKLQEAISEYTAKRKKSLTVEFKIKSLVKCIELRLDELSSQEEKLNKEIGKIKKKITDLDDKKSKANVKYRKSFDQHMSDEKKHWENRKQLSLCQDKKGRNSESWWSSGVIVRHECSDNNIKVLKREVNQSLNNLRDSMRILEEDEYEFKNAVKKYNEGKRDLSKSEDRMQRVTTEASQFFTKVQENKLLLDQFTSNSHNSLREIRKRSGINNNDPSPRAANRMAGRIADMSAELDKITYNALTSLKKNQLIMQSCQ